MHREKLKKFRPRGGVPDFEFQVSGFEFRVIRCNSKPETRNSKLFTETRMGSELSGDDYEIKHVLLHSCHNCFCRHVGGRVEWEGFEKIAGRVGEA